MMKFIDWRMQRDRRAAANQEQEVGGEEEEMTRLGCNVRRF